MTFDANDVLRVISKWDAARLEKLGATVGKDHVTATEEQLRSVPSIRFELLKAGLLTIGAEGGGSGGLDWVPANAKIHIDLVNDRAWTEADGLVAIDTLLGTDANANRWSPSIYDATRLTSDGYVTSTGNELDIPALIGTARSAILAGATFVVQTKSLTGSGFTFSPLVLMSADYNDAVEFDLNINRSADAQSFSGPLNESIADIVNEGIIGAINKLALTITTSRVDFAVNGSGAVSSVLTNSDRPIGNPFVAAVVDPNHDNAIQSITIYDPLPDTTGLPELSRVIPEDAKIHINLVQDWAWTEADGIVAIDTLLGTDPNTVNGWSASTYDASRLTADGYTEPANAATAFIGAARDKLLAGATTVFRCKALVDVIDATSIAILSADGNDGVEVDLFIRATDRRLIASPWSGSTSLLEPTSNVGSGAYNTIAVTITSTRLEAAANGIGPLINTDAHTGELVAAIIDVGGSSTNALQSVSIYDALPDTTGLSALSQTGVTNTAPTAIDINWTEVAPNGVWSVSLFHGDEVARPTMVDAEGNPAIFTVVASDLNVANLPIMECAAPNYLRVGNEPDPGTYNFTLRATDPGGLYVEQTFTITVTA